MDFHHIPVLAEQVIKGLELKPAGLYLDATVGGGGHSRLMLDHDPTIKVVGLDQDEMALQAAQTNLQAFGDRVSLIRTNFSNYQPTMNQKFDGILADLGVSSPQFDVPERGFSFKYSAPLDMRMDQRQKLTAATIINRWPEKQLADLFYEYGEERKSRRIAQAIVRRRPLRTTTDLADVICSCVPRTKIHPATRVFQALRIAVNEELKVLEQLISHSSQWLKPEGILGIISFHSLEDRIVKYAFRDGDSWEIITKKPLVASREEIKSNPRSRSAKLRFARKATP
jgi:16S rRNA (cytosine1402-N4)-methyltransferase